MYPGLIIVDAPFDETHTRLHEGMEGLPATAVATAVRAQLEGGEFDVYIPEMFAGLYAKRATDVGANVAFTAGGPAASSATSHPARRRGGRRGRHAGPRDQHRRLDPWRSSVMTYAFDPELAPVIPSLHLGDFSDVAAARAMLESMLAGINADVDTSGLTIEDRTIDGPDGTDLSVRVLRPTSAPGPLPAVLHIHGGGFAVGSVNSELGGCVQLASRLPAVVVSVEYRLAPEYPFPAGIEDCYTALCWLHTQVDALGVDPKRVAVSGGSAGGGLAAGLALMARDRGGPSLCFQFLGHPRARRPPRDPQHAAIRGHPDVEPPERHPVSWKYYLGDAPGPVSPYAAPARAENLADLPPAFVSTMEFDPLRDEGIIYALRMLQAGVSVELHQYPGTFHGSAMVTTAAVSKRQSAETVEVMKRALYR